MKKGMIFGPFDLKTGTLYKLCLFWSGITGMVFQGTTGVHERICRFNSKWIRKRVRVKCDFEIDFKLMGSWYDDKIFPRETYVAFVSPPGWKTDMYFRGHFWKGVWKWHFWSENGVRIWRTGWHTPTKSNPPLGNQPTVCKEINICRQQALRDNHSKPKKREM